MLEKQRAVPHLLICRFVEQPAVQREAFDLEIAVELDLEIAVELAQKNYLPSDWVGLVEVKIAEQ